MLEKYWRMKISIFLTQPENYNPTASATEKAIRLGINYNLPFTNKLANFHLELTHQLVDSSPTILTVTEK